MSIRHINIEKFQKEAIDLATKGHGNRPSFTGGSLYVEMRDKDHAELLRADLEQYTNANWGDGDKNSAYGTVVKMYKLGDQNGRTEFVYDFVPGAGATDPEVYHSTMGPVNWDDIPEEVDTMLCLEAEIARGK
jgi:hypothetical protein